MSALTSLGRLQDAPEDFGIPLNEIEDMLYLGVHGEMAKCHVINKFCQQTAQWLGLTSTRFLNKYEYVEEISDLACSNLWEDYGSAYECAYVDDCLFLRWVDRVFVFETKKGA